MKELALFPGLNYSFCCLQHKKTALGYVCMQQIDLITTLQNDYCTIILQLF